MSIKSWKRPLGAIVALMMILGFLSSSPEAQSHAPVARAVTIDADFVLKGGTIYDGSNREPYVGDVAIKGDEIVAVGRFDVDGDTEIIDVSGFSVAPGFIDLHSHSDNTGIDGRNRSNENYLRQGCTTIVTGNCGSGKVRVAEYFEQLTNNGIGTNVAHWIPQGSVRNQVMGSDARRPTESELQAMRELVAEGMEQGAMGLSTGLIYLPSSLADTNELIELSKVVSEHGGIYVTHMRGESGEVLQSLSEAITIGHQAHIPVHVSHIKCVGPNAWGLSGLMCDMIQSARERGLQVTADQYPYPASSTSMMAMTVPPDLRGGGTAGIQSRFDDPDQRSDFLKAIIDYTGRRGGPSRLMVSGCRQRPEFVGRTIAEIAEDENREWLDVLEEILRYGGTRGINFGIDENDMRNFTVQPYVATASDGSASALTGEGKPHPRSFGTFPRKIGLFARDRGWLSANEAIRSCTGLPADILGLADRGYVMPNMIADIVVFDPDAIQDHATFAEPRQHCTGIKYVYVAGTAAVIDDEFTGALAGRVLRHGQSQP